MTGTDNQVLILLASLVFNGVSAIAITAVSIIARSTLSRMGTIEISINALALKLAGDYYPRADHNVFAAGLEERIAGMQKYAREGIGDNNNDLGTHSLWIHLLAQHLKFTLPPKPVRIPSRLTP